MKQVFCSIEAGLMKVVQCYSINDQQGDISGVECPDNLAT